MPNNMYRVTWLIIGVADLIFTEFALGLADHYRPDSPFGVEVPQHYSFLSPGIYLLVGIIWVITLFLFQVYSNQRRSTLLTSISTLLNAIIVASFLLACSFFLLKINNFSRVLYGSFLILDAGFLVTLRLLVRSALPAAFRPRGGQRIAIIGASPLALSLAEILRDTLPLTARLVGYIQADEELGEPAVLDAPLLGDIQQLPEIIKARNLSDIYVALSPNTASRIIPVVLMLHQQVVSVKIIPTPLEVLTTRSDIEEIGGIPLLQVPMGGLSSRDRLIKRTIDVLLSSLLVVLTAPLMVIIAWLITVDSPGPIIFKQKRVGENGKLFWMFKFRTMFNDPELHLPAHLEQAMNSTKTLDFVHKVPDDPRVTRLGRFLRRSSLDELPQFFNVLSGSMSLVGPRPELPEIVARYRPWQLGRLATLPGMTGWWQVNGRSDHPLHLSTEYDMYYISHYSLLLDLRILLRTLREVVRGQGAY